MLTKLWADAIKKYSNPNNSQTKSIQNQLLPNDLGGKILDMEIICDSQNVNKQSIVQLIQLYATAIQYYQGIACQKYKYFQKRIQKLLLKPVIQQTLKGNSTVLSIKKQKINLCKQEAMANSQEQATKIIQLSNKKIEKKRKQLHHFIKDQQKSLQNRIERRKSMSNKSSKSQISEFDLDIQDIQIDKNDMGSSLVLGQIKNKTVKRVFL